MPTVSIHWIWEEAFSKFGFGDGDGWNGTNLVADFLRRQNYEVECERWGIHNYMIFKIIDRADNLVAKSDGYADPRKFLPASLVSLLDNEFPN